MTPPKVMIMGKERAELEDKKERKLPHDGHLRPEAKRSKSRKKVMGRMRIKMINLESFIL